MPALEGEAKDNDNRYVEFEDDECAEEKDEDSEIEVMLGREEDCYDKDILDSDEDQDSDKTDFVGFSSEESDESEGETDFEGFSD